MSVELVKKFSVINKGWVLFTLFGVFAGLPQSSRGNNSIILGPIEGELAKKQIPLDLGRTPQALIPLVSKPIFVHGGLRLAHEKESKYSVTFSSAGKDDIQVVITQ